MQRLNKTLAINGSLLAVLVLSVFQIGVRPAAPALSATPEVITSRQQNLVPEEALNPSEAVGITWGPSYYANDTIIEPERNRPELNLMKQVDRQMLTGKTWGPSYTGDYTIVAPGR